MLHLVGKRKGRRVVEEGARRRCGEAVEGRREGRKGRDEEAEARLGGAIEEEAGSRGTTST